MWRGSAARSCAGEWISRHTSVANRLIPGTRTVLTGISFKVGQNGTHDWPIRPTLFELMDQYKTPDVGRQLTRVILASGDLGRPMVASPGTPPDRVNILPDAYARAMKDPGLIDEAKKGQMDMEHTPGPGENLQALLKEIMDQPRDVVDRVKKILAD